MDRHELYEIIGIVEFIAFGKKRRILQIKAQDSFSGISCRSIEKEIFINFYGQSIAVVDLQSIHVNGLSAVRLIVLCSFRQKFL